VPDRRQQLISSALEGYILALLRMTALRKLRCRLSVRASAAIFAALTVVGFVAGHAQTAATLGQVRKIYVEPFSGKRGAGEIRDEVIDRLKHHSELTVVGSASQADAVLKGSGDIWVSGYIGNNPRAQASNRSPIYSGYLSLTLEGADAQPLWSSMVTPAGSLSSAITFNLADHGAKLLLTAVAHDRESPTPSPNTSIPNAPALRQSHLSGAGATFPAPLYQAWIQSFRQVHPEIHLTYAAVGSEEGIQKLLDKQVDFAASDMPTLPDGAKLQRFATVLGAVVPVYNLSGVDRGLRFTPEILAGIYLGKIIRWDAREIRDVNRGISLPNAPIFVVHRSDGSGTTYAFTEFLSKTSPTWKAAVGVGGTTQWPTGSGATGNDGVASLVQKTPNSIGYVELTYAIQKELSFGAVRNSAGAYAIANLESLAAAAQSAAADPGATLSITDAPGRNSYPITTFTWIVLLDPVQTGERTAVVQMLQWMLTFGQKQSSALGYAPLPRGLASQELKSLAQLK
jgi:phosphate transport system substrate-binding protein